MVEHIADGGPPRSVRLGEDEPPHPVMIDPDGVVVAVQLLVAVLHDRGDHYLDASGDAALGSRGAFTRFWGCSPMGTAEAGPVSLLQVGRGVRGAQGVGAMADLA